MRMILDMYHPSTLVVVVAPKAVPYLLRGRCFFYHPPEKHRHAQEGRKHRRNVQEDRSSPPVSSDKADEELEAKRRKVVVVAEDDVTATAMMANGTSTQEYEYILDWILPSTDEGDTRCTEGANCEKEVITGEQVNNILPSTKTTEAPKDDAKHSAPKCR